MRRIKASSPTKAIIAGEHSVVYGGMGLAVPLDNRKACECEISRAGGGEGKITVEDSVGSGKYFGDGRFEDADGWFGAKARLIEYVLKTGGRSIGGLRITMRFSKNKIPKGTGHSASTAAAMALCLYGALGVAAGKEKLFEAVQAFEEVAHGGSPSGIDAQTVLSDSAVKFRKIFLKGTQRLSFEGVGIALPEKTVFVIADTLMGGETPAATSEMIRIFAETRRIANPPAELSEGERQRITKPFDDIVEQAQQQLYGGGDAEKLGGLMNRNHLLLREAGVSSDGIEAAVKLCLKKGALGAKLTGAGGRGGAVLALCREKDAEKMINALEEAGMGGIRAELSRKGAHIAE